MPYLEPSTMTLPFQSGSDTSRAGAVAVAHTSGTQRDVMTGHYRSAPFSGRTDAEMHSLTGFDINVITARRNELGCVPCGKRAGAKGVPVHAWILPIAPLETT